MTITPQSPSSGAVPTDHQEYPAAGTVRVADRAVACRPVLPHQSHQPAVLASLAARRPTPDARLLDIRRPAARHSLLGARLPGVRRSTLGPSEPLARDRVASDVQQGRWLATLATVSWCRTEPLVAIFGT